MDPQNRENENTDYDIGYFQGVRDLSMLILQLSILNAHDLQTHLKRITDELFKINGI